MPRRTNTSVVNPVIARCLQASNGRYRLAVTPTSLKIHILEAGGQSSLCRHHGPPFRTPADDELIAGCCLRCSDILVRSVPA